MGIESDRIHRHLEDELGQCRPETVADRLAELEGLESTVDRGLTESDLPVFSTLGNETRYRLARLLVAADGELCVCELNAAVDVSESAVSHALTDLREAGLVSRRKDGRWRMYRATPLATALISALDEVRADD